MFYSSTSLSQIMIPLSLEGEKRTSGWETHGLWKREFGTGSLLCKFQYLVFVCLFFFVVLHKPKF